tara:strand:- start:7854 stop:8693 length:840 start_codon:yes stop_codon:yes gene_type:complete
MASSYVSSFLRQQGLEKEKNKNLEKVFTQREADRLLSGIAQMNQSRGVQRRGRAAASESSGADASANTEVRKYAHEEAVEVAEQQQILNWVNAGAASTGALMAYYAEKLEKDAIKEAEEAAIAEAESSEEAAMLTDYRKPGEEYSPSMLRDPFAVGDFSPDAEMLERGYPMYDPDGKVYQGQVDASTGDSQIDASSAIYKDGMNATEYKAAQKSPRELVQNQNEERGRSGIYDLSPVGIGEAAASLLTPEEEEEMLKKLRLRQSRLPVPTRAPMIGDAE